MPCSTSWSAIVLPTVCAAGMTGATPSMLVTDRIDGGVISFTVSNWGVGASIPVPPMGHTSGLAGTSVFGVPRERFVLHDGFLQSGLLSLRTPKFDPPTTSR